MLPQGRVKGRGIDCVGIVLCTGELLGLRYRDGRQIGARDFLNYGRYPVLEELLEEARKLFVEKPVCDAEPGDILVLRSPKIARHLAIASDLGGHLGVIHAEDHPLTRSPGGRVVEHLLDADWKKRIAGVFSFPDVD